MGGKVRSRRDSPRKELLLGEGEAQAWGGGEKRFHSLPLLSWGRRKNPLRKAIKSREGGGEQQESTLALRAAHHCFAGRARWPRVNQGTTLNSTSRGALAGTSAGLRVQWRGGGGDS